MADVNARMLAQTAAGYVRKGDLYGAQLQAQKLLKKNKRSPEGLHIMAETEWHLGHYDSGLRYLQKLIQLKPGDLALRAVLARRLRQRGRIREAVTQYDKLLRKQPDSTEALAGLARCYVAKGDNEKAANRLQRAIDAGTEDAAMAQTYVIAKVNAGEYEPAIAVAERHLNEPVATGETLAELWHALGRACERTGNFERAFEAFTAANQVARPTCNRDLLIDLVKTQIKLFTKQRVEHLPRSTIDTSTPVFVVGMPRCGSTLVERIIAAHPQAHSAGEFAGLTRLVSDLSITISSDTAFPHNVLDLEKSDVDPLARGYIDELRAVAPKAVRIVDKYLGNVLYLALVEALFPQARVIDMRRDPVDNGFACYTALLGQHHPYSYDLRDIAWEYRGTERLMNHWLEVLSIPILRVDYEQLVQDQEAQTRRIIEFCDLPWDDACLRFHEIEKMGRSGAAPTLSYSQVRRPMYTSSVNRAEQYGTRLNPLREELAEAKRFWADV